MTVQTEARNADLASLRDLLVEQHARKIDMVVPASAMRLEEGILRVRGVEPLLQDDGVLMADGHYRPTRIFDEGLAERLGIPLGYLRRLRESRPDLLDANVNGWLHGRKPKVQYRDPATYPTGERQVLREGVPGDERSFLVRGFRNPDGGEGVARALLSNSYAILDNLDVLTAALDGVRQAGVDVQIEGCDLTDRRMYVRVIAPQVKVWAEDLLRGYRSPFRDGGAERAHHGMSLDNARALARAEGMEYGDGAEPVMFAGFVISNSETGDGAFTITPRMVIQVCKNGLTITKDAMRNVHLGGKMDEGVIRWSQDTTRKASDLITAKARDAVSTYLDVDYMKSVVDRLTTAAEIKVKGHDDVVTIAKKAGLDQAAIDGVLNHFILGGQMTAGGVMAAVTSYAQTVDNADRAHDLEGRGLAVLDAAASLR